MDGNGWQRMTSEMRQAQKIYGLRVTRTSPLEEKPMRDKANPPGTGTGPSRANPRMRGRYTQTIGNQGGGKREKARKKRKERRTEVRGTVVSVEMGEKVCGIVAYRCGGKRIVLLVCFMGCGCLGGAAVSVAALLGWRLVTCGCLSGVLVFLLFCYGDGW